MLPRIEKQDLARLIRRYWQTKVFPEELAKALHVMATGINRQFRFIKSTDDFAQGAMVYILEAKSIDHANPRKNLFSYFYTIIRRYGLKIREELIAQGDAEADYIAVMNTIIERLHRRFDSLNTSRETRYETTAEFKRRTLRRLLTADDGLQPVGVPDVPVAEDRRVAIQLGIELHRHDHESDHRHRRGRGRRSLARGARRLCDPRPRLQEAVA